MKNLYEVCYEIIYNVFLATENSKNSEQLILGFLNTDKTYFENLFNQADYFEFNQDKRLYKNIMKLIIFSCSYKMLLYEKSRDIYYEDAILGIEQLEQLDYYDILEKFSNSEQELDILFYIDSFYNYVRQNYIFVNNCIDQILEENKVKQLLKLNPFELLMVINHIPATEMTKSEKYIQIFIDNYFAVEQKAVTKYPDDEEAYHEYLIEEFIENINIYFKNDNNKINEFYGYVVANLYENILILLKEFPKYRKRCEDFIYLIEDEKMGIDDIIKVLLSDEDLFTFVIEFFLDYNVELVEDELIYKREKFKKYYDLEKLNRFTDLYKEEEKVFKIRKIKHPN